MRRRSANAVHECFARRAYACRSVPVRPARASVYGRSTNTIYECLARRANACRTVPVRSARACWRGWWRCAARRAQAGRADSAVVTDHVSVTRAAARDAAMGGTTSGATVDFVRRGRVIAACRGDECTMYVHGFFDRLRLSQRSSRRKTGDEQHDETDARMQSIRAIRIRMPHFVFPLCRRHASPAAHTAARYARTALLSVLRRLGALCEISYGRMAVSVSLRSIPWAEFAGPALACVWRRPDTHCCDPLLQAREAGFPRRRRSALWPIGSRRAPSLRRIGDAMRNSCRTMRSGANCCESRRSRARRHSRVESRASARP